MQNKQTALIIDDLQAANDEEFAVTQSLARQSGAGEVRTAQYGWDAFEVWRTRIKSHADSTY